MTTRTFLRNDGQFAQVDAGSISISTTTTTGFLTYLTKTSTANVSMASSATIVQVTQGSSGTWLAMGTVTFNSGGGAPVFVASLWDGTTLIALSVTPQPTSSSATVSLSGVISSPAGNIRIDGVNGSATGGQAVSGECNLVTIRIG